jgi:hypothetical protein
MTKTAMVSMIKQSIKDTIEVSIFYGQGNPDIKIPDKATPEEICEAWCQIKTQYPEWWLKFDHHYICLEWGMSAEYYWRYFDLNSCIYTDPPKDEWLPWLYRQAQKEGVAPWYLSDYEPLTNASPPTL